MRDEILSSLKTIEETDSVRIVVIKANGRNFCAGMDLGSSNQAQLDEQIKSGTAGQEGLKLFETIRAFPKPTICLINGPVLGGGWGIVMACDVRIATSSAWFQMPEVKRGIVPALISAFIVPSLGIFATKQLMLTGERVPSTELYRLGGLSKVAQNEDEASTILSSFIKEILGGAPGAQRHIKELVTFVNDHEHKQNLQKVVTVFSQTVHSKEAMHGISCFVKKEDPNWQQFVKAKL